MRASRDLQVCKDLQGPSDPVESEVREGQEDQRDHPDLEVVLETRDPLAVLETSECRVSRGRRVALGTWVHTEPLDPGGGAEGQVHPELWVQLVSAASRVRLACRVPRVPLAAGDGRGPRDTTD